MAEERLLLSVSYFVSNLYQALPQQTSPHTPEITLGHISTPKLHPEKGNETTTTHLRLSGYLRKQTPELWFWQWNILCIEIKAGLCQHGKRGCCWADSQLMLQASWPVQKVFLFFILHTHLEFGLDEGKAKSTKQGKGSARWQTKEKVHTLFPRHFQKLQPVVWHALGSD